MKASRLLSILMLLQSRERMTAASLAQALDVSERTIMRDVDQLSAAGVPIWAERGREGGLRLQQGWSTRLTGMTEHEANALLLAGMPGPAAELGLGEAALSARLKLVASLPMPMRDQAARVADRLHIDPVDWYRAHDTPTQLREVADAVWRSARIRVRYASWRKTSWRELEPMGLILKAGAWYVAAREAGKRDVRTYRLAHVLESQSGRGTFKRPPSFDLARYWRESSARFENELRPLQARVWMSPWALEALAQTRSRFVELPVPPGGREERAGWRPVLLAMESVEEGARHILGFGGEAEVIEPVPLRNMVSDMAGRIYDKHSHIKRSTMDTSQPPKEAR